MSGAVGTLQKPQLRGLINRQIGRNLIVGIILAISGGIAFKVLVNDRHKRKHAEFFRNYDIEKDFDRIRNLGLFDSCKPDS